MTRIAIIGCGWVGLTTAAIMSSCGYETNVIDLDENRILKLQKGVLPFYEIGLDKVVNYGLKTKKLIPTTDIKCVSEADIIISCVGTPDAEDGSVDLSQVFEAAENIKGLIKSDAIYVQKSTVPVGTGKRVMQELGSNINYVSNPEFLSESTAIRDTLYFDRTVVGGDNKQANEAVLNLYKSVIKNVQKILDISEINIQAKKPKYELISTGLESAELIKVTSNAFLALKISFANSIAQLADATEADILEVMKGVGSDSRIGEAFLQTGRGYGGGCFPKDVAGLISTAKSNGIELGIMNQVVYTNNIMPSLFIEKASTKLGSLKGKKIAVLGLSFKKGTSDVRRSQAINIANELANRGAEVIAYDPEAMDEARPQLHKAISLARSIDDCINGRDAVFIATDWDQFKGYDLNKMAELMTGKLRVLVDCMNIFSVKEVEQAGINYVGIGRKQFSIQKSITANTSKANKML